MLQQARGEAGSCTEAPGLASATTQTPVLFVLGSGRSGSTLLANLDRRPGLP